MKNELKRDNPKRFIPNRKTRVMDSGKMMLGDTKLIVKLTLFTPKGLNNLAQGQRIRATLGQRPPILRTLKGFHSFWPFVEPFQGSSDEAEPTQGGALRADPGLSSRTLSGFLCFWLREARITRTSTKHEKTFPHRSIIRVGLQVLAIMLCIFAPAPAQQSVLQTKHNLSASGPGPVRAMSEQRVCIFCHTPHGGRTNAPLWNRRDTGAAYIPYDSPTLKAQPGQPTGSSKLCLSCHDGTIAMGDLVSESQAISMSGSQKLSTVHGLIGTDLRDDHPISFSYMDSFSQLGARLNPPGSWDPRVRLDAASEVQCTTCHNPHNDQFGKFMVMDNQESALCRACHKYDAFAQTSHATSTRQWNGSGANPWPNTDYHDVRTNACLNCHASHHAEGQKELLTSALEENVCYACHNGSVASFNLQAVFNKPYHHPVELSQGAHQDGENPLLTGDHVECVDCHNPHRARVADAVAPNVKGVLEGVSGVDATGAGVSDAVYEYQICFKCHADKQSPSLHVIARQISSLNALKDFSPSSPSFHPVETAGRNPDVPSLISPLSPASMIYCSDCHNNDQPGAPGSAGPHGSSIEFMLAAEYRTGDNITESPANYALCYKCHSRASIIANESFKFHSLHVVDKKTPCSVCHDAHGIDFNRGNTTNNAHLINFDTSVVQPLPGNPDPVYRSLGPGTGDCSLRCHEIDHAPKSY